EQVARTAETTPFVVLLAAFQTLLGRFSGQDDIWVGSPTAGRVRRGLEDVVGYFANPVGMRGDLSGDPTFAARLEQQREAVRGALEHQALPFATIAERVGGVRQPGRSPLFDVMFTLQSVQRIAREGVLSKPVEPVEGTGQPGARIALGELVLE